MQPDSIAKEPTLWGNGDIATFSKEQIVLIFGLWLLGIMGRDAFTERIENMATLQINRYSAEMHLLWFKSPRNLLTCKSILKQQLLSETLSSWQALAKLRSSWHNFANLRVKREDNAKIWQTNRFCKNLLRLKRILADMHCSAREKSGSLWQNRADKSVCKNPNPTPCQIGSN